MKRLIFILVLALMLASIAITGPAQAAGGPHGRSHRKPHTHRVTCLSSAAQSAAYAWMNGLRGIGGVAYTTRFRKQTLAYARTEPGWFRAKVKRAARLQDRGRTQQAIGAIWSALERPCQ